MSVLLGTYELSILSVVKSGQLEIFWLILSDMLSILLRLICSS